MCIRDRFFLYGITFQTGTVDKLAGTPGSGRQTGTIPVKPGRMVSLGIRLHLIHPDSLSELMSTAECNIYNRHVSGR